MCKTVSISEIRLAYATSFSNLTPSDSHPNFLKGGTRQQMLSLTRRRPLYPLLPLIPSPLHHEQPQATWEIKGNWTLRGTPETSGTSPEWPTWALHPPFSFFFLSTDMMNDVTITILHGGFLNMFNDFLVVCFFPIDLSALQWHQHVSSRTQWGRILKCSWFRKSPSFNSLTCHQVQILLIFMFRGDSLLFAFAPK